MVESAMEFIHNAAIALDSQHRRVDEGLASPVMLPPTDDG